MADTAIEPSPSATCTACAGKGTRSYGDGYEVRCLDCGGQGVIVAPDTSRAAVHHLVLELLEAKVRLNLSADAGDRRAAAAIGHAIATLGALLEERETRKAPHGS